MTTLAQYRTAVSSKVGLDNSTVGDQGLIDGWVNEGVLDLLMRTGCRVRTANMTLTPTIPNYSLDAQILKIIDIEVTSSGIASWMEQATIEDINALRRSSAAFTSPAQYFAVLGSDMIAVYPTPLTADELTIYYVPRPVTLSASSDSPDEIPAEFQKAIEYYALSEAADMSDDQGTQMGMLYLNKYEQWIKRIKRWVNMKGHHRMPNATVRGASPVLPFRDRSTYP